MARALGHLLEEDLPEDAEQELRDWQAVYRRYATTGGHWAAWEARTFDT